LINRVTPDGGRLDIFRDSATHVPHFTTDLDTPAHELPPAYAFLRTCARVHPSEADYERMREIAGRLDEAGWEMVLAIAENDGMQPLVFQHAADAGLLAHMPPIIADLLAHAYRITWIYNRRLRGELAALLAELRSQGVDVLLVKGIALAGRYYGEIAERPISDIDLLVHPDDVDTCRQMLIRRGYTPTPGMEKSSEWRARVNRALAYHHALGFEVEIHWALASLPPYMASFPLDSIWCRAEHIELAGRPARYLSAADELRYLCYHYAAQHQDRRLIWLVDIAERVRVLPPTWDWGEFSAETIALGLAMPVASTLGSAERILGLSLPPGSLLELRQAAALPQEQRAWRAARADRNSPRAQYAHLRVQRTIASRLAFIWSSLLWHLALPARRQLVRVGYQVVRGCRQLGRRE
jgi:hypothetical protein